MMLKAFFLSQVAHASASLESAPGDVLYSPDSGVTRMALLSVTESTLPIKTGALLALREKEPSAEGGRGLRRQKGMSAGMIAGITITSLVGCIVIAGGIWYYFTPVPMRYKCGWCFRLDCLPSFTEGKCAGGSKCGPDDVCIYDGPDVCVDQCLGENFTDGSCVSDEWGDFECPACKETHTGDKCEIPVCDKMKKNTDDTSCSCTTEAKDATKKRTYLCAPNETCRKHRLFQTKDKICVPQCTDAKQDSTHVIDVLCFCSASSTCNVGKVCFDEVCYRLCDEGDNNTACYCTTSAPEVKKIVESNAKCAPACRDEFRNTTGHDCTCVTASGNKKDCAHTETCHKNAIQKDAICSKECADNNECLAKQLGFKSSTCDDYRVELACLGGTGIFEGGDGSRDQVNVRACCPKKCESVEELEKESEQKQKQEQKQEQEQKPATSSSWQCSTEM